MSISRIRPVNVDMEAKNSAPANSVDEQPLGSRVSPAALTEAERAVVRFLARRAARDWLIELGYSLPHSFAA